MNATQTDILRFIRSVKAKEAIEALSDRQLLEMFLSQHSEASFTALVQRHGAMVFGVCRRLLRHTQDAEDAFQATFLALARQAHTIRRQDALGSWLHGVAYRIAEKMKRTAARRSMRERRMSPLPCGDALDDITWRELRWVLDEELQRLPEKYRAPLVLCYLEARTQDEAARRLGWCKNTFGRRINQARQMLARRLTRRGLTLSAALSVPLLTDTAAQAALPSLLVASTVRAGLAWALGNPVCGIVSSQVVALAESGVGSLLVKKANIAFVLLASLMLGVGSLLAYRTVQNGTLAEAPPASSPPSPPVRSASKDQTLSITGRVLDPDGKPLAGARLLLTADTGAKKTDIAVRATTDKDGQFRFTARATDFDPQGKATLAATAQGFGLDWIEIMAERKDDLTLRLVKDDVPIEGRLLDLEGQPVEGVRAHVVSLHRGDLNAWIKVILAYNGPLPEGKSSEILGASASAVTGKDGRFRLTGIGRERGVELTIRGPGIEWARLWAVTRPGPARGWRSGQEGLYGATFDWVAGPCKPIIGTVRDKATGKPVIGLHVSSGNTLGATVLTDRQGRYRINGVGKRNNYSVGVWGVPYLDSWRDEIPDTPGLEPLIVDYQVQRGIAITGRLIDKNTRKPVQGWVLCMPLRDNPNRKNFMLRNGLFTSYNNVVGQTNPEGSFQVVALPGPGLLCVRTDDADRYPAIRPDPALLAKVDKSHLELNSYQALVQIDPSESNEKPATFDIVLEPRRALSESPGKIKDLGYLKSKQVPDKE